MMQTQFQIPKEKLEAFCQKFHIKKLSLFGSVLTSNFNHESDIDVLVEFKDGHTPGLSFFAVELELSDLFNRKVDLNTPDFLSPLFRESVMTEATLQYAAS